MQNHLGRREFAWLLQTLVRGGRLKVCTTAELLSFPPRSSRDQID